MIPDLGVATLARSSLKKGFERFKEPREVLLAVKGRYAKLIGDVTVHIEVEGYVLPERETIGVIEGLIKDAIVGSNILEKYGIYIEGDDVKFKQIPPTLMIV